MADLLINPSGGVETCSVILSSGFQDLDQATCALIQTRARFVPATDAGGHTMYSVTRSPPITWSLGSFHTVPVEPDYDLTINRAPDGVRLPFELKVEYLVTRDGNVWWGPLLQCYWQWCSWYRADGKFCSRSRPVSYWNRRRYLPGWAP